MTARPIAAFVAVVALVGLAGCGGGKAAAKVELARPVPGEIVPADLPAQNLTIQANTTDEVKDAVKSVGPQLLVSDARLWELHLGGRALVGQLFEPVKGLADFGGAEAGLDQA